MQPYSTLFTHLYHLGQFLTSVKLFRCFLDALQTLQQRVCKGLMIVKTENRSLIRGQLSLQCCIVSPLLFLPLSLQNLP